MKRIVIFRWKSIIHTIHLLLIIILAIISSNILLERYYIKNSIPIISNNLSMSDSKSYFSPGIPSKGSIEEIYQDVFMAFLDPHIKKAVEEYYGRPFSVDPWSNKVLYIRRPNGYRTICFELEIKVIPYYGPHNSVGIDHITLTVNSNGDVVVSKFEHIETHDWFY